MNKRPKGVATIGTWACAEAFPCMYAVRDIWRETDVKRG